MTIGSILNELKNINRRLSTNQYEFLGQIIGGDYNTEIKDYKSLIDKINTSLKVSDEDKKILIDYFTKFNDFKDIQIKISLDESLKYILKKFNIKNLLLKGVPGTGKSHIIDKIIKQDLGLENKSANVLRINIHSASSNADLMQGIAITTESNQVAYKEKQGLIFEHIRKACFSPYEPFVIVLEEIQENSLNELIGDLIYLCEDKKRTKIHELNSSIFTQDEYEYQHLIEKYIEEIKKLQKSQNKEEFVHTVEIPNLVSIGENRKLIMPDNLFIFCTSNYRDDKKVIEDNLLRRFDVIEVYPQYKDSIGEEFISQDVSGFLSYLNEEIHKIFKEQNETHPDRFLIGHASWLDVKAISDEKFYKALLKVVVEFKEIREVDYKIIHDLFKTIKEKYKLEIEYSDYKSLVNSLQNKVYSSILSRTESKQEEQSSSQE
jgi:MoxR-like ATPase